MGCWHAERPRIMRGRRCPSDIRPRPRDEIPTARGRYEAPSVARCPPAWGEAYLVQLVDQLDRLQLEREVSTPELSVELQLDRLQLERDQSALWELDELLQEERLQLERE